MSCFLFFFLKVNIKNKFALTATLARAERENMQACKRAVHPRAIFVFVKLCFTRAAYLRGRLSEEEKKNSF